MYGIFTYIWLKFMVTVGKYSIHSAHMRIHRFRKAWNSAWCLENKILTEDKDPIPPLKQPPPHLNRIPTEGKSIVNTDGSEIRRSTVEVGSLSQYLQGISVTSQVMQDFWTSNSSSLHPNFFSPKKVKTKHPIRQHLRQLISSLHPNVFPQNFFKQPQDGPLPAINRVI